MKFENGIFDNVNINDYHADKEYMSATTLKEAAKTMAHLRHYLYEKEKERKSHFDFGNAFEIALMDVMNGTDEFDSSCALFDDLQRPEIEKNFNSTLNREWKKDFFDTNKYKYILNASGQESKETMDFMLESCWKTPNIQLLLKNTDYQKTIFWTDEETGIKLKTRPDVCKINKQVIIDIKTTKDASPNAFKRDAANYDYPLQAITQIEGVIKSGLMSEVDYYYWLAIEKNAPYNAQIYHFTHEDRDWNHDRFRYILERVKEAMDSDIWNGYSDPSDNFGILDLELPLWFRG